MSPSLSKTLCLLSTLLYASCILADAAPQNIPEACQTHCASPYGQVLGTVNQVTAYSNCNAQCVVRSPNYDQGTYTGIKWQCVEFARRWLLTQTGVVYGDVDTASDIWKLTTVTRPADNHTLPFETYTNGSHTAPQVGDLLIYAKEFLNTGHVAVITHVDLEEGEVRVAEQNFANLPWTADYARTISLVKQADNYWILDAYLLGWKHVVVAKS